MREVVIEPNINAYAEGSALIKMGMTHVFCIASVEATLPKWLAGSGKGWVSAEYNMLPRANRERKQRDISRGKQDGRSVEIQRLIGRSLRSVVDMRVLGEHMIWVDCDVFQADGGTRCASITGGAVALAFAIKKLIGDGVLSENPMTELVAAVSVVKIGDDFIVDPTYEQDSAADVDMNVIMTESGNFVEIQGTAEGVTFSRKENDHILDLAEKNIQLLIEQQKACIGASKA